MIAVPPCCLRGILFPHSQMRTALHLACIHHHQSAAVELAFYDPSTLDAFDKVRESTTLAETCNDGIKALASFQCVFMATAVMMFL